MQWLNAQRGIEAISDLRYRDAFPEEGWPRWMKNCIKKADIVLCICGKTYKEAFAGEGGGRGGDWEGAIITDELFQNFSRNKKFSPILPEQGAYQDVPELLLRWNSDILLTDRDQILRHIKALHKIQQESGTREFS